LLLRQGIETDQIVLIEVAAAHTER
jgi:hypothetical protein